MYLHILANSHRLGATLFAFLVGVAALAVPSAALAYVDCLWSDMPCREGEVCGWDPDRQVHRCLPTRDKREANQQAAATAVEAERRSAAEEPACEEWKYGDCVGDFLCDHAKEACRAEVREHNAKCRALKEAARKRGKARVRRPEDTANSSGEAAPPSRREVEEHQFNRWWKCHQLVYENDPDCRP